MCLLLGLAAIGGCADDTGPLGETVPTGPPPEAVALDAADAMDPELYGISSHFGTSLSFTSDGRLIVGAPSIPHGPEPLEDLVGDWVGLATEPLPSALDWIRDPLAEDGDPSFDGNLFGSGVLGVGDVTGDGVDDIAARTSTSMTGAAYWHIFPGPDYTAEDAALILSWPTLPWHPDAGAARCGDLDADGVDELCVDNGVFFGPVTDDELPELSWSGGPHPLTAGDTDGDGVAELFVGDLEASQLHRLASFPRSGPSELAALAADTWSTGTGVNALALGDLDADGVVDLVAGTPTRVLVGPPTGGGDLESSARTILGVGAWSIAVGDFDGDGVDDLAVGGEGIVSVWLGPLPAGTLQLADADAVHMGLEYGEDGFGLALDAADTDGDGVWELAIGAPTDGEGLPPESVGVNHEHGRVWWLPGAGL